LQHGLAVAEFDPLVPFLIETCPTAMLASTKTMKKGEMRH
jgi:hypothetical protein